MKRVKEIVPEYMILPIILTLLANAVAYYGSRAIMLGKYHYDMTLGIDNAIPFLPWTVIIYWGCYIFWIVNYVIGCRQEKSEAYRLMCSDVVAKMVCMVFFIVLPTACVRPEIVGDSFFDNIARLLYIVDSPDNLFPSIHLTSSWFAFIAVRKNDKVKPAYKVFSFIMVIAIAISTLTTKQHVFVDTFTGIALAEAVYRIVGVTGVAKGYEKLLEKATKALSLKKRKRVHS